MLKWFTGLSKKDIVTRDHKARANDLAKKCRVEIDPNVSLHLWSVVILESLIARIEELERRTLCVSTLVFEEPNL